MNRIPIITVFMAACNGALYINEAINSVLNQTFKDFELLIINDGSQDNTEEIVKSYTDSRIRLLNNEKNEGLIFTRNRGIEEAKGRYLAILDCDDIAMPDRLQLQYDFMRLHPEIALCGGHALQIDGNSKIINEMIRVYTGYKNMGMLMTFGNMFVNSSIMMKLSAMKDVGGYANVNLAEDFDLSLRIGRCYEVANLDCVLIKYRTHGQNISGMQFNEMKNEEFKIIQEIQNYLGMNSGSHNLLIYHTFFSQSYNEYDLRNYAIILEDMKTSNIKSRKYDIQLFNKMLYNKWYDLIREKGGKKSLFYLLKSNFFNWSFVTSKQLRKVFKQSFWAIFNKKY